MPAGTKSPPSVAGIRPVFALVDQGDRARLATESGANATSTLPRCLNRRGSETVAWSVYHESWRCRAGRFNTRLSADDLLVLVFGGSSLAQRLPRYGAPPRSCPQGLRSSCLASVSAGCLKVFSRCLIVWFRVSVLRSAVRRRRSGSGVKPARLGSCGITRRRDRRGAAPWSATG